ncbi:uncharacterized protein Z518_10327 [Rhinocladiella mackenziei CBS 650.93]|uniref:Rhodanese domain-containing protein n=1 Tax=Rhinocladiella mackenziei CBS 650.93 TaxID=1442369 RepID=A0A0D2I331_9EURO|nr:uncharacterized protein Z518_10327 [Rhinocladiella mackenziei CBS 650.93]KIX00189.1 hypothetical protein Z518_10327 [Rhinocladiella mackenziei CBS 650.93]
MSPLLPAPPLASGRYNRQLLLPQLRLSGQLRLLDAKVLLIGLGGLGSPASLYLAGAGVGTLGLMDGDTVELGNLHRQIGHSEAAAQARLSKVQSTMQRCREVNSSINYAMHEERARAENVLEIVAQYDLVLDCTDNPATRYLISDACVVLRKVLISGAAQRGEGMMVVLNSPPISYRRSLIDSERETARETIEKGPCYRCVFPRPPPPEMVRGCSEIGILGPVVGVIGTLMASEAIKIIVDGGHSQPTSGAVRGLAIGRPEQKQTQNQPPAHMQSEQKQKQKQATGHTMLLYNTYSADPRGMFRTITLRGRRKDCTACGDDEALARKGLNRISAENIAQGRLDYQAFCGMEEDVKVLGEKERVEAREFLDAIYSHSNSSYLEQVEERNGSAKESGKCRGIVIDVREEHEYELGPKVRGSVNIPMSRIQRLGGAAFDGLVLGCLDERVDGGMVDQEMHIPVTKCNGFRNAGLQDDGQYPHAELYPNGDAEDINEEDPESVYFVCQRGNDSQIAAKKLIERIKAEAETADNGVSPIKRKKWGWIGDVKGGYVAMEKHLNVS